jgi:hypothetical protein
LVEKREKRRRKNSVAMVESRIATIDRHLKRFRSEMEKGELKLTDYLRLAELESIAADGGEGDVIVRWVDRDAVRETEDDQ